MLCDNSMCFTAWNMHEWSITLVFKNSFHLPPRGEVSDWSVCVLMSPLCLKALPVLLSLGYNIGIGCWDRKTRAIIFYHFFSALHLTNIFLSAQPTCSPSVGFNRWSSHSDRTRNDKQESLSVRIRLSLCLVQCRFLSCKQIKAKNTLYASTQM